MIAAWQRQLRFWVLRCAACCLGLASAGAALGAQAGANLAASSSNLTFPAPDSAAAQSVETGSPGSAVGDSTPPSSGLAFAPVPLFGYAPETSVKAGLLLALFSRVQDPSERPSHLALLGLVTGHRQLILEMSPEVYWDAQRFHLWNKIEYQYFPDRFFGIGNETGNVGVPYTRRILRGRLTLERQLVDHLWAGVFGDVLWFGADYGPYASSFEGVTGLQGGRTVGAGSSVSWDSRDSAMAATQGTLAALSVAAYPGVFGGDYPFWRVTADARHIFALGGGHLIAVRGLLERDSAGVPYYLMAQLGGADLLRGYYRGRYRDRALADVEAEYRTPFFWRVGAALFAGLGRVGRDLEDLRLDGVHPSVGAGLRLNIARAEHVNLRGDIGIGKDGSAVYASIGEAF